MKNIFPVLLLMLVGCTKDSSVGELNPSTKSVVESPKILEQKIFQVGREKIEMAYFFYEEEGILETVVTSMENGESVGKITHRVQGDFLVLIGIESGPCICNPDCWAYNEPLCDWWTCVDEFVAAHDSELLVLSVVCPECGAGALSGVGFMCAQQGSLIQGN